MNYQTCYSICWWGLLWCLLRHLLIGWTNKVVKNIKIPHYVIWHVLSQVTRHSASVFLGQDMIKLVNPHFLRISV